MSNKNATSVSITNELEQLVEQVAGLSLKLGTYGQDQYALKRGLSDIRSKLSDIASRVPRWIDVNEQLPPPNTDVVANVPDSGRSIAINLDDVWFDSASIVLIGVTHWMPLPEPPEASDEFERQDEKTS